MSGEQGEPNQQLLHIAAGYSECGAGRAARGGGDGDPHATGNLAPGFAFPEHPPVLSQPGSSSLVLPKEAQPAPNVITQMFTFSHKIVIRAEAGAKARGRRRFKLFKFKYI